MKARWEVSDTGVAFSDMDRKYTLPWLKSVPTVGSRFATNVLARRERLNPLSGQVASIVLDATLG